MRPKVVHEEKQPVWSPLNAWDAETPTWEDSL